MAAHRRPLADANGDPIFAVMAPPSASTAAEIRRLLPDLRSLIGKERRTTIVFDRGGWSPEVFSEIIDANFDLLTYRKSDMGAALLKGRSCGLGDAVVDVA